MSQEPCHLQDDRRYKRKEQPLSNAGVVVRQKCPINPGSPPSREPQNEVVNQNAVEGSPQPPPVIALPVQDISAVNWDKVLYVVFDLETTWRSQQRDEIIELAAQVLDPSGIQLEDGVFAHLVKPNARIPAFITELTSITNESVSMCEQFPAMADSFIRFM